MLLLIIVSLPNLYVITTTVELIQVFHVPKMNFFFSSFPSFSSEDKIYCPLWLRNIVWNKFVDELKWLLKCRIISIGQWVRRNEKKKWNFVAFDRKGPIKHICLNEHWIICGLGMTKMFFLSFSFKKKFSNFKDRGREEC